MKKSIEKKWNLSLNGDEAPKSQSSLIEAHSSYSNKVDVLRHIPHSASHHHHRQRLQCALPHPFNYLHNHSHGRTCHINSSCLHVCLLSPLPYILHNRQLLYLGLLLAVGRKGGQQRSTLFIPAEPMSAILNYEDFVWGIQGIERSISD